MAGFVVPLTDAQRKALRLVDELEAKFAACEHPHAPADVDWCNVCGATRGLRGGWLMPHWRDVIVQALLSDGAPERYF